MDSNDSYKRLSIYIVKMAKVIWQYAGNILGSVSIFPHISQRKTSRKIYSNDQLFSIRCFYQ